MNAKIAEELIQRYLDGKCTAKEKAQVESWYTQLSNELPDPAVKPDYKHGHQRLAKALPLDTVEVPVRTLWKRWVGVAAAVAVVAFGIWFYNTRHLEGSEATRDLLNYAKNDIAPGKNTASLVLSNGKTVQLSDAKNGVLVGSSNIVYNDSTALSGLEPLLPAAERGYLTAITPRGGTYQITLPDGTKVWLNAASKLEFPSDFRNISQRIVKLEGEAYFEVAKNKVKPFIVQSLNQSIEVLGTHFNVNAYTNEGDIKTTLLEGSVRVALLSPRRGERSAGPRGAVTLKPNQQSLLTSTGNITIKEVDPSIAIAWKNKEFMFENMPLPNIMRMVERWYNVEVIYNGPVTNELFWGSVSRFENVSKVLSSLEATGKVHFKIEERKIYVSK